MNKYNLALAMGVLFATSPAMALQAMDDNALAEQTGQDGVTIGLDFPNSTISFNQAIITDTDGMAGATGSASLVIAPQTYSGTQGIRLFKDNSSNSLATAPIKIKIDSDGNAGKPVLNAAISLPSDMQRLRINPFSIYLATGSSNIFTARKTDILPTNTLRVGVTELFRLSTEGIDVVFAPSNPLTINVQLGNAPQNHMFMITGGSILCVGSNAACMTTPGAVGSNPIELISGIGTTQSSLKLGFSLKATDQVQGFRLNGFYADVVDSGLVFGKEGITDKFDAELTNVVAGLAGAQDPTVFNNLKNGSMGNFGAIGAQVTNLKVNVKGM